METREELEAEANRLGVKFAANIGDDKLRERVEAAQAAEKATSPSAPANSQDQGNSQDPVKDQAGAPTQPTAPAQPTQSEHDEDLFECDVLEDLRHNGTHYEPGGDPVSLTRKQVIALSGLGVVARPEAFEA